MKLLTATLLAFTALSSAALAETQTEKQMHSFDYVSQVSNPQAMAPVVSSENATNADLSGHKHRHHMKKHMHKHAPKDGVKKEHMKKVHHHHHHHTKVKKTTTTTTTTTTPATTPAQ